MRLVRVVVTVLVVLGLGYGCQRTFIHVRSKASEARTNLKVTWQAHRAFFADAGRWATSFDALQLEFERGNRYRYALAPAGEALPRRSHLDGGAHPIILSDEERFGPSPEPAHLAAIPPGAWEPLDAGAFVLIATGNLDLDPTLDVWRVVSTETRCNGAPLEAGIPCHLVDDAAE
jgi:hypothetical protein